MDGKHGVDVRYPQVRHVRFVTLEPAPGRGAAPLAWRTAP